VRAGETLGVVGESGSGKSVTALAALGLIPCPPGRIDGGNVWLRDKTDPVELLGLSAHDRRKVRGGRIAMIFQEPMTSLNPVMRLGDQIVEAVRAHRDMTRREARREAVRALDEVGIQNAADRVSKFPHEFSGGMRQRVMIAMALACQPAVLLADEPTTALDVTIQKQVLDLIDRAKHERGMGVVLITHDLGVVRDRAERIAVMYAGRVLESGGADLVLGSPKHPYTKGLLACAPGIGIERADRLPTVEDLVTAGLSDARAEGDPWWPGDAGDYGPGDGARQAEIEGRNVLVWSGEPDGTEG